MTAGAAVASAAPLERRGLRQKPEWYASAEARAVADIVIQYQSPHGGWPKATNLPAPPRSPQDIPSPLDGRANTIDNDATTLPYPKRRLAAVLPVARGLLFAHHL